MLLVGLLMILIGAALALAGLFTSDVTTHNQLHVVGIEVSPATLFILGAVAVALVLLGLRLMKAGAKHEWRQRQEQKKYEELGEKLARANRDRDLDED